MAHITPIRSDADHKAALARMDALMDAQPGSPEIDELSVLADLVESFDGMRLRIGASAVLDDVHLGDSIAVNGCCLTVVANGDDWWEADVSQETLDRTSLRGIQPGSPLNMERAVKLQDRLGGHLVQGHVDAVGEIVQPVPDLQVRIPQHLLRYVVEKGSITVDGTSLTVAAVHADGFSVAVIPHTAAVTSLGRKGHGDVVNIEVDVMAKYVERLLKETM